MRKLSGLLKSMYTASKGWLAEGSPENGGGGGSEAADAVARDAKKKNLILTSSGTVVGARSDCFVSVHSRRGEKGVNQDCSIVWQEFGGQEDMIFCGLFDGHGPWGHFVAKTVRESLPPSLLCNRKETLASFSIVGKCPCHFDIWKQSYLRACTTIDKQLKHDRKIDSFRSGTTALTIVKQGELMVVANVGDSRAVLATTSDDGALIPLQLTIDFRPNLPQEAERIMQSNGLVFCLQDEPGVQRLWLPNGKEPGLAMSRAFGDYCVKDFGLTSMPEVTQRRITNRDRFIILATDGVWDVVSNHEAVQIVSSTKERGEAAKRLVKFAIRAWKNKRQGIAVDDCSVICLFFHNSLLSECYSPENSSLTVNDHET